MCITNPLPMPLLPYLNPDLLEAGLDEAGRGCLAGPVVASAVILPKNFHHGLLNDSKKLTKANREWLVPEIEGAAIAYRVASVSPQEIDRVNILQASFLAMHRAVAELSTTPEHLLVDGNRFKPYPDIEATCVVKGDGKYYSIAAASVLAKVYRDRLMAEYAEQYPQYGWEGNAGYPTKKHRQAIAEHGATPLHRHSFQLLPAQKEFGF